VLSFVVGSMSSACARIDRDLRITDFGAVVDVTVRYGLGWCMTLCSLPMVDDGKREEVRNESDQKASGIFKF
jgi:hypothetical protein